MEWKRVGGGGGGGVESDKNELKIHINLKTGSLIWRWTTGARTMFSLTEVLSLFVFTVK